MFFCLKISPYWMTKMKKYFFEKKQTIYFYTAFFLTKLLKTLNQVQDLTSRKYTLLGTATAARKQNANLLSKSEPRKFCHIWPFGPKYESSCKIFNSNQEGAVSVVGQKFVSFQRQKRFQQQVLDSFGFVFAALFCQVLKVTTLTLFKKPTFPPSFREWSPATPHTKHSKLTKTVFFLSKESWKTNQFISEHPRKTDVVFQIINNGWMIPGKKPKDRCCCWGLPEKQRWKI